jgi:hypothetical protein
MSVADRVIVMHVLPVLKIKCFNMISLSTNIASKDYSKIYYMGTAIHNPICLHKFVSDQDS